MLDTNLAPAANDELARQVESLEPSAALLNSKGFAWMVAAYLAAIVKSGKPDIAELRSHGLSEKTSVSIATAIAARHARRNAALARVPLPTPAPTPKRLPLDQAAARSLVHDLCLQISAERGEPNELHRAGFSWETSKELATLINATRDLR